MRSSPPSLRFPVALALALASVAPAAAQPAPPPLTAPDLPEPEPQYPFVCTTARNGLGQPSVDNHDREGIPVAREDPAGTYPMDERGYPTAAASIVGWSRDCGAEPEFRYLYLSTAGEWTATASPAAVPAGAAATAVTTEGDSVEMVVRLERGTLNRFIYSVAMLAPRTESDPRAPDRTLWNRRLLFSLQGGVGIGHSQGMWSEGAALLPAALGAGYAVVNSTGLRTNTHFNLLRGGRTASMLKDHFSASHGEPLYTIAFGASGGAIQQYLYQQNHPRLFDGGVPQYSYPDMVTQTIHTGDCELLEHYFERTDAANPRWSDVEERSKIIGLNAERDPFLSASERKRFADLYELYKRAGVPTPHGWNGTATVPLTECRPGWFGLTALAMNPQVTNVEDLDKLAGPANVQWTHWADAPEVYGVDEVGWARQTWDNEGVQYGLAAVRTGGITPGEFLRLNALVGGWKHASEMVPEGCPHDPDRCGDPGAFDPWSSRQMNLSTDGITPAARTRADTAAIRGAFERGHVFLGQLNIPLIDSRHYLEHQLDMHNVHQSFAARQRILDRMGSHANQLIWFTDARPGEPRSDPTMQAFAVLHDWIMNIRAHPERGVAGNRPAGATDRCWTTDGRLIAEGDSVWAGILDHQPPGACSRVFPLHATSRIRAGAPIRGDLFRCRLMPVAEAVRRGIYGSWIPEREEIGRLEEIFPTGVCDHTRSGAVRGTSG